MDLRLDLRPPRRTLAPYAPAIDIAPDQLLIPATVDTWISGHYTLALRHDQSIPAYNHSFRQHLRVGFKFAAKMGRRCIDLLEANEPVIAKNVIESLYTQHIAPVFLGRER